MPVRPNRAKDIIRQGGCLVSTAVRLPEPSLVEILGYAGFDFVLIDGEHGSIGWSDMERMILAAHASDTVRVVRVLKNEPEMIMRSLDLGAQGILIPHCCTAEDARCFKQGSLYAPQGTRGVGPGRSKQWGVVGNEEYYQTINDQVLLLAMIEDPEAIDNIEAIAQEGLDVLWVGTGDLAASYGVPGQLTHPKVVEASQRVLEVGIQYNIAVGWPAQSPEDAARAASKGYRAIGCGGAEGYVMAGAQSYLKVMR